MSVGSAVGASGSYASLESLTARLIATAAERGLRIVVAESLTGGKLADALVSVPGASRAFSGGIVAYDTALKESLLGVDSALLRERGPVDSEVARQMAAGVRAACAVPRLPGGVPEPADIGLATTGVAGPDPDAQTGQPAGVVWVGVSCASGTFSVRLDLGAADRETIRSAAVAAAIGLLGDALEGRPISAD